MTFLELTEKTPYSPVTLAQTLLYKKKPSNVSWIIQSLGYEIEDADRSMITYIASGKKKLADYYPVQASEDNNKTEAA